MKKIKFFDRLKKRRIITDSSPPEEISKVDNPGDSDIAQAHELKPAPIVKPKKYSIEWM